MLMERQIMDVWKRDYLPAVYDWYSPRNFSLLGAPPAMPIDLEKERISLNAARRVSFNFDDPVKLECPTPAPGCNQPSLLKADGRAGGLSRGDLDFARKEPRTHCRFAAGQVVPKPCIAAMFSMEYYTPGVLEILESLVYPSKLNQAARCWCIAVPARLLGSPYPELALEVLRDGGVPLGLLRRPVRKNRGRSGNGTNKGGCDSSTRPNKGVEEEEEEEGRSPLPYAVTATPLTGGLQLEAGDLCYVVANDTWAFENEAIGADRAAHTS